MNLGKVRSVLALLLGLATTIAVLYSLSVLGANADTSMVNSTTDGNPSTPQRYERITADASSFSTQPATTWGNQAAEDDAEACTIAIATGDATVDGRPMLWKNRDYFGYPDAWQSNLFWHEATGQPLSVSYGASSSYCITDCFNYVAVSDRGDRSDPQDITETLYYPRMGANNRGLAVVSAQAHTLSDDVQTDTVKAVSQDPDGIRNGGLNHWILSRCETITEVAQLLTDTNKGGYNDSIARDTASLIAVIDRFGGAVIFEVDGNSFARQNITQEFALLDERPHSSGAPVSAYTGFDYRSNFSRITFTNTSIGFPYFPDVYTNVVSGSEVITLSYGTPDGINDLETSTSSVKRWGRVAARMDDASKDYRYFIQRWLRKGGHPREFYLETVARSVGYGPYLTSRVNSELTKTHNWKQEKPTGWHLNRFATVSSAVIVGSKAGDQDEGKLTTMWVALGEPSVSIFVPVFPYAGKPPDVLDNFFLSVNAKRRLVYDYETDYAGYPVDNIGTISRYVTLRNADHSIDLSALFGGNYYGEGGLQAYNFAIEDELFRAYQERIGTWRELTADKIEPATLASWQAEKAAWAVEEYVKSNPTAVAYEAEDQLYCSATTGKRVRLDEHSDGEQVNEWAWQLPASGYLSCPHQFAGHTIIEVIAKGTPYDGQWPGMKVFVDGRCLTEVGGETESDCSIVVSPTNATNKAKSVGEDTIDPNAPRFALYRYRTTLTGTATLTVEAVSATSPPTLTIDKIILRTEPRSVEMYEVEKDWDAKSDKHVEVGEYTILLTDTTGFFDIHHYAWGGPLSIAVVVTGFSTNPSPVLQLSCNSQLVGTDTLTTAYKVCTFPWQPQSEGPITCRIQPGNFKDIRVDKLLVQEDLPVNSNTAPIGCFSMISTVNGLTRTITATAVVIDLDGDDIASYFWDFGDGESYCSANPVVTHTYSVTESVPPLTPYVTDHRGKTTIIYRCRCIHLPSIVKNYP